VPQKDAELFEISVGQIRQDLRVDFVFAERGFVLAETEVPQPSPDVHGRLRSARIIALVQGVVKRRARRRERESNVTERLLLAHAAG
jgi:hypothetical protein